MVLIKWRSQKILSGRHLVYRPTYWPTDRPTLAKQYVPFFKGGINITSIFSLSFFLWQDFSTGIKIFVLVILAIFGIGHYQGHLCFTYTFCSILISISISKIYKDSWLLITVSYECGLFPHHVQRIDLM